MGAVHIELGENAGHPGGEKGRHVPTGCLRNRVDALDRRPHTGRRRTTSLPDGVVGEPYSATLQATGGSGTYTWSIAAGALPAGLTLDAAAGVISGTLSTAETASFTVRASDAADADDFADLRRRLRIAGND